MSEGTLVLAVLAVGIGGSVLLYLAVRSEGGPRATMSRSDAELTARRDTADPVDTGRDDGERG